MSADTEAIIAKTLDVVRAERDRAALELARLERCVQALEDIAGTKAAPEEAPAPAPEPPPAPAEELVAPEGEVVAGFAPTLEVPPDPRPTRGGQSPEEAEDPRLSARVVKRVDQLGRWITHGELAEMLEADPHDVSVTLANCFRRGDLVRRLAPPGSPSSYQYGSRALLGGRAVAGVAAGGR